MLDLRKRTSGSRPGTCQVSLQFMMSTALCAKRQASCRIAKMKNDMLNQMSLAGEVSVAWLQIKNVNVQIRGANKPFQWDSCDRRSQIIFMSIATATDRERQIALPFLFCFAKSKIGICDRPTMITILEPLAMLYHMQSHTLRVVWET